MYGGATSSNVNSTFAYYCSSLYRWFRSDHTLSMVNHFLLWILFFVQCQNALGNRITALDLEEQVQILIELGDEVQVTKRDYDSHRIKLLSILKPGDHTAAERKNGMYEHHGIYEGESEGYPRVIHFQGPITSLVKKSASRFCISNCGYQQPKNGGPVFSCLDCFSQRRMTYKMQYRLKNKLLSDQDPSWNKLEPGKIIAGYRNKKFYLEEYLDGELYGHSSVPKENLSDYKLDARIRFYEMSSERSREEVLDVARDSKFKPYSLGCNNCEHFAVFCKTGLGRSIQVEIFSVPIICKNGKRVWRLMARGTADEQNGKKKQNQEVQDSSEPLPTNWDDEEEKELLEHHCHKIFN